MIGPAIFWKTIAQWLIGLLVPALRFILMENRDVCCIR